MACLFLFLFTHGLMFLLEYDTYDHSLLLRMMSIRGVISISHFLTCN
jgi:hypothetical protein